MCVIRFAKVAKSDAAGTANVFPFSDQDCPENAFRTERAKKTGKVNQTLHMFLASLDNQTMELNL